MRTNFSLLTLITLLGYLTLLTLQASIDPSAYIWVDYNQKPFINLNQNKEYETFIPCSARIKTCTYNFVLTPPGWKTFPNGTVILPAEDATKDGAYALKVILSEPTGEKLTADLVATIQKGFLSVSNSADFFHKTGFNPNAENTTKYEQSPVTKNNPDSLPDLKKVEELAKLGKNKQISDVIEQAAQSLIPCRSKANYLKSVKQILNRQRTNNSKILDDSMKEKKDLQAKLDELKAKKSAELRKMGVAQQLESLDEQLTSAQYFQQYQSDSQTKYRKLANNTLQLLRKAPQTIASPKTNSDNDNESNLTTLKQLEENLNNQLKWAVQARNIIIYAINQIQLIIAKKDVPVASQDKLKELDAKFLQVLRKLVESEVRVAEIQVQWEDQHNFQDSNRQLSDVIDQKLKLIDKSIEVPLPETDQQRSLRRQNEILTTTLKIMEQFSFLISHTCDAVSMQIIY